MRPTRSLLRALIPVVFFGLVALGLVLARGAESEGGAPRPQVELGSAGGALSAGPGRDKAVFRVPALGPGQKVAGTLRVSNSGDSPGLFLLSPDGRPPSEQAQLELLDVTGAPAVVYTGAVGSLDTRPLGVLRPGSSRTYRVTAAALESQAPMELALRWWAIPGLPSSRLTALLRSPADRRAPRMRLAATPRQRLLQSGRLISDLRCDERCRVDASAFVTPSQGRRVAVTVAGATQARRRRHRLWLVFGAEVLREVEGALEQDRPVPIAIRLTATDRRGNTSALRETVRLRPTR